MNFNPAPATQVGQYSADASPYGVLDMAGNVGEWVTDWFDGTYYASSPRENPQGPASGNTSQRGGAWDASTPYIRVADPQLVHFQLASRQLWLPLRPLAVILECWFLEFWIPGTAHF